MSRFLRKKRDKTTTIMETLLNYLKNYGGRIISSNELTPSDINEARLGNRMWVDNEGFGFIWVPQITKFPETVEEVELYESWYPVKPNSFEKNWRG